MKAYHICYHTDEDGTASAAVIYEYLKRINKIHNNRSVKYFFYKIDYTIDLKTVLPDIPSGDDIYFLDYSFSNKDNLKYILELSNNTINVIWIDHHKTSMGIINKEDIYSDIKLNNYPYFHHFINTNYCGAYLSYIYAYFKLNGGFPISYMNSLTYPEYIPLYIKYVDSWDTWKHNMPNTTEFNIGMRSVKHTPKSTFSQIFKYNIDIINKLFSDNITDNQIIDSYMKKFIDNIIFKGKIIKEYQDIENESLCNDYGFEFNIIDNTNRDKRTYHCFALNKRGNSTMFGDKINKYDIVVPFQFNGTKYVYSLYTAKNDVDCEDLAKKLGSFDKLGGGGHTKAAGFQTYDLLIDINCKVRITNALFRKNKYYIISDTVI